MLTSREKSPLRCCITQDSEPNTLPTEVIRPPGLWYVSVMDQSCSGALEKMKYSTDQPTQTVLQHFAISLVTNMTVLLTVKMHQLHLTVLNSAVFLLFEVKTLTAFTPHVSWHCHCGDLTMVGS